MVVRGNRRRDLCQRQNLSVNEICVDILDFLQRLLKLTDVASLMNVVGGIMCSQMVLGGNV